jgi:glycosyltransferase involved in cell wall biosynthesis
LFSSYHCYLDPSSGAALSAQDLLTFLQAAGWRCHVLCGPYLDFEEPPSLEQLLNDQQLPFETSPDIAGSLPMAGIRSKRGGVAIRIHAPPSPARPEPGRAEGNLFLALFERVLEDFRPDVVVTYGREWVTRQIIAAARRRNLPVVFWLCTCAYEDGSHFQGVDGILVPSCFAQAYYQRTLGLACTAIPCPVDWSRVRCPQVRGQYVTFVNPQPYKGAFWVARLARELGTKRPDIPLLIVEGRGKAHRLHDAGLDLAGLANLYVAGPTPDPRDFYAVSRVVLMPSLCPETFGRVAAEAMINGIPVLASRRGGLPETLGQGGFLFDIPGRYTTESLSVPTAEEVAPWLEVIFRLWDDQVFYEGQRRRCLRAAQTWRPERLGPLYEQFFGGLLRDARRQTRTGKASR